MRKEPTPPKDLWEQLNEIEAELKKPPEPPEGSFSVSDYAEKRGLKTAQAGKRIRDLINAGKVQKFIVVGRVQYYKIV